MADHFWLSDAQGAMIEPHLPKVYPISATEGPDSSKASTTRIGRLSVKTIDGDRSPSRHRCRTVGYRRTALLRLPATAQRSGHLVWR